MSASLLVKRQSTRIAGAATKKAGPKKLSPRRQWLVAHEEALGEFFDKMQLYFGAQENEGKHTFENFAEACADAFFECDGDSTDDEDEVEGLCSEDEESATEDETDEEDEEDVELESDEEDEEPEESEEEDEDDEEEDEE